MHRDSDISTLAAVLELKIRLSHCRDQVTFWLQGLNTQSRVNKALNMDRRLFFSLPYLRFCTSLSIPLFPYFHTTYNAETDYGWMILFKSQVSSKSIGDNFLCWNDPNRNKLDTIARLRAEVITFIIRNESWDWSSLHVHNSLSLYPSLTHRFQNHWPQELKLQKFLKSEFGLFCKNLFPQSYQAYSMPFMSITATALLVLSGVPATIKHFIHMYHPVDGDDVHMTFESCLTTARSTWWSSGNRAYLLSMFRIVSSFKIYTGDCQPASCIAARLCYIIKLLRTYGSHILGNHKVSLSIVFMTFLAMITHFF